MKKIVTGCIYAVDLHGTEAYEFKGIHPAMIVRMLKEEKMYYVVPLTTYTKERWEKCKRIGFGCRIHSTNSIARVDKMNVISEKQIQKRYYNAGKIVCAQPEEVEKVMLRVEEYLRLSDMKGMNEYKKYFSAKEAMRDKLIAFFINNAFESVYYDMTYSQDGMCMVVANNELSHLTFGDLEELLCELVDSQKIEVTRMDDQESLIKIYIEESKVLTFKTNYDKFKVQKGNVNM